MPAYPRLGSLLHRVPQESSDAAFARAVIPYLVDVWLDDYARSSPVQDVVETSANNFAYLFDVTRERLIAAWGISRGAHDAPRDKGRMAGHPLSAGPLYHRGHAIPHSLGGPLDINLVPQRGSVNVGAFRELEKAAVRTPGRCTSRTGCTRRGAHRRRVASSRASCPTAGRRTSARTPTNCGRRRTGGPVRWRLIRRSLGVRVPRG